MFSESDGYDETASETCTVTQTENNNEIIVNSIRNPTNSSLDRYETASEAQSWNFKSPFSISSPMYENLMQKYEEVKSSVFKSPRSWDETEEKLKEKYRNLETGEGNLSKIESLTQKIRNEADESERMSRNQHNNDVQSGFLEIS